MLHIKRTDWYLCFYLVRNSKFNMPKWNKLFFLLLRLKYKLLFLCCVGKMACVFHTHCVVSRVSSKRSRVQARHFLFDKIFSKSKKTWIVSSDWQYSLWHRTYNMTDGSFIVALLRGLDGVVLLSILFYYHNLVSK